MGEKDYLKHLEDVRKELAQLEGWDHKKKKAGKKRKGEAEVADGPMHIEKITDM